MNTCISRCNANWVNLNNTTRLLIYGKHATRLTSNKYVMQRSSAIGTNILNITNRNISTSYKFHVSFVYTVSLKTGDRVGAGTDSSVFVRMIGDKASTSEVKLKTAAADLERGQLDHFTFPSDDVGPLKKIIIRHDNTGFAPGWFLDYVKIRDGRGKNYHFECNDWLVKGESYDNIKLLKERSYISKNSVISIEDDTKMEEEVEEEPAAVVNEGAPIEDLIKSQEVDKEILHDLKVLEGLSSDAEATVENAQSMIHDEQEKLEVKEEKLEVKEEKLEVKEEKPEVKKEKLEEPIDDKSARHATSLSPAVRNILDTYGIEMGNVSSSGPDSRILKGDVLAYILKENLTKKIFLVNTVHDIEMPKEDVPHLPIIGENYSDHVLTEGSRLLARELKISKFEVPHLYMSTSCDVDKLDTFITILFLDENKVKTRNIVLTRILSRSLVNTQDILLDSNEDVNILLTHNGKSITLKKCQDADVGNLYNQYEHFKDTVDALLTTPRYGLNIVDNDGVTQLSSVLRVGQVISLNIGGTKLGIDTSGKLTRYLTLSISCDNRVISEVTCALLLENCKKYLSNPDLLGL